VELEWDETKNKSNRKKHDVDFSVVERFDWVGAGVMLDERQDYGEERFIAYGHDVGGEGYVIVFTIRDAVYRIISARRFGRKDDQFYDAIKGR